LDVPILLQHLNNCVATMSQWLSRSLIVADGDATMIEIEGLHTRRLL